MATNLPGETPLIESEPTSPHQSILNRGEDLLVSAAMAAIVLLPLLEAVLRPVFHVGISGSTAIVQHLTLVVGMLGGAIAAREGRLLSLSTVGVLLKGRAKTLAEVFGGGFATAIAAVLCAASINFVRKAIGGNELAYGIPVWAVALVMPIGFAAIAIRLLWHAGKDRYSRGAAMILAGAVVLLGLWPPVSPEKLVIPALVALFLATVFGAPVFVTLGGAALILFWGARQPIAVVTIEHYRQVINPSLPAIPLFTLAGYLLAEGGASRRLIRVFQALVGHFRGGPAIAAVLVCAFFTSFTGASGVTILALGGLLLPVLLAARYSERNALGLLTGAGSLGLLWPPCLPMILYAVIANRTIKEMFLGGVVPGALLVVMAAAWGIWQSPREDPARHHFSWLEAKTALLNAKWELLLPVVAFTALFGGFTSAVEAAALTALYALIIETFVYRDLKMGRDVPRVMTECSLLIGGVLLILGVALGFTSYLIDAQVPDRAVEWATSSIHSPLVFLLALNGVLLVVGCLMDIYSAIVVVVPLMTRIGEAFGINPVHLGIIFLANLELGFLTPPVGMNLFLSSYRFRKPMSEVIRSIVPLLIVLLIGVLLITYIPAMSTALPQRFK